MITVIRCELTMNVLCLPLRYAVTLPLRCTCTIDAQKAEVSKICAFAFLLRPFWSGWRTRHPAGVRSNYVQYHVFAFNREKPNVRTYGKTKHRNDDGPPVCVNGSVNGFLMEIQIRTRTISNVCPRTCGRGPTRGLPVIGPRTADNGGRVKCRDGRSHAICPACCALPYRVSGHSSYNIARSYDFAPGVKTGRIIFLDVYDAQKKRLASHKKKVLKLCSSQAGARTETDPGHRERPGSPSPLLYWIPFCPAICIGLPLHRSWYFFNFI